MRHQKEIIKALKIFICITFTTLNMAYSNAHAGTDESPPINQIASTTVHMTTQRIEHLDTKAQTSIEKLRNIIQQKDATAQKLMKDPSKREALRLIFDTVLLSAKNYLIKKNEIIQNLAYKINDGTFNFEHPERIAFRDEINEQINKTIEEVLISKSIEGEEETKEFKIATDYLIYSKLENIFSDASALEKFISGLEDTEKTECEPVS